MSTLKTTVLEKAKHEFGDVVITEDHYSDTGNRFYTIEFQSSKKARKTNPNLPLVLSITDGTIGNAKAGLVKYLARYIK